MKKILLMLLSLVYATCYPVKPVVDQANIQEDTVLALAQELYAVTLNTIACHTEKSIDELALLFKTNTQVEAIILQAKQNGISAYALVTKAHQLARDTEGDDALCTNVLLSVRKKDWHYWIGGIKPYVIYGTVSMATLFVVVLCARSHKCLGKPVTATLPNHTIPLHDVTQNPQTTSASTLQNTVITQPALRAQVPTTPEQEHIIAPAQPLVNMVPADTQLEAVVITCEPIEAAPVDIPAEVGISANQHTEPVVDLNSVVLDIQPLPAVCDSIVVQQDIELTVPAVDAQPSVVTSLSALTPITQAVQQPQPGVHEDPASDDENDDLETWLLKERARMDKRRCDEEQAYLKNQQERSKAFRAEQEKKKALAQEYIDTPLIKFHYSEEPCAVCQYTTLKDCLDAKVPAYNLNCCAKSGVVARFICQTCFQRWEKQFAEMMRVMVAGTKSLTMADFRCPCCYKTPFDKNISSIEPHMVKEQGAN